MTSVPSWFGLWVTNGQNQVLVSSETRNFHFLGKAQFHSVERQTNFYGGLRQYNYVISSTVPVLPFFTMPVDAFYGITGIRSLGDNWWNIEISRSGTSGTHPEVYVFADPRAITPTEEYGMIVYRDDGTPSFDSRRSPLVVVGDRMASQAPPPRLNTWGAEPDGKDCSSINNPGGLLVPNSTIDLPHAWPGAAPIKPIYNYSSLAQTQQEGEWHRRTTSTHIGFPNIITTKVHNHYSTYWIFCRGGIKRTSSGFQAGWITVHWGCHYRTVTSSSILLGLIPIGSSASTGGKWPYSNETLNHTWHPIIIADGARYDAAGQHNNDTTPTWPYPPGHPAHGLV